MAEDALLAEMRSLRDRVVGIADTALASRDGLIIRADTGDIDPEYLAAMAAAALGLGRRMAAEVGKGALHEIVTRSSGGYVATYAVGPTALLVLVGDAGLDSIRLHRESQVTIKNLELLLAGDEPGSSAVAGLAGLPAASSAGRAPDPAGKSEAGEVAALLELVPPGVVSVMNWNGDAPASRRQPPTATFLGGVARKLRP
jgi:uncharacterized protein